MGGGASKSAKGADGSSMAIKEIKERSDKLEKEVEKLEQEKKAYEKQLGDRSSDIEKLGEFNRNLEREKESLVKNANDAKQDQLSAEKGLEMLRKEMDEVKANASKFEASMREIKGDLIVEKEEKEAARDEIERIGQILTDKVTEQEEVEKRVAELEEEKQELDNMLRLSSESAEMYKDLSSKLMVKKPKEGAAAAPAVAAPIVKAANSTGKTPQSSDAAVQPQQSSEEKLLARLKPKQDGRFKVCIISTFEEFFMEREALKRHAIKPLNDWCDRNNCVLEFVDLWEGVLQDQYSVLSAGFHIPSLYFQEIEDADIVLLLLGEKYGSDISEETCVNEANIRPWMSRHRAQQNRYGSALELAVVYASFIVGHDSNLAQNLTSPRVISYIRDPAFVQGLPEAQLTKHFQPEGTRQTAKLEQLKARVGKAGLVRNAAYADPNALSSHIAEDLQTIFGQSLPKPINDIQLEKLTHDAYLEAHSWIGQGEKGVALPDTVNSIMERIRKYALTISLAMRVRVCVCICVGMCMYMCMFVRVCVREKERESVCV